MRDSEKLTVEVQGEGNTDFGVAGQVWDLLCEPFGEIAGMRGKQTSKTGRLVRSGDQMESVFDETITIRYHRETHRAWQSKRVLRITDDLGDEYGVKSMKVLKGRVWFLKMGCIRN